MKLDGEKLLADLLLDYSQACSILRKTNDSGNYYAHTLAKKDLLEQLISSIQSDNYTIKDKG